MPAIEVKPGVYWIGVNDRTTDLFEGVWPISHEGVSYNSYVVRDEKTALIDLAKAEHEGSFIGQINDVVDVSQLDYVILNHMEPDHTGALSVLRQLAPNAQIICSKKAKAMLESFFGITENVRVVSDGEEISLGATTLQFYYAPFVHWPETMVTYQPQNGVLFACDAFGGYGALKGSIFDDQCQEMDFYLQESLRYYVNIVARFSGPTLRAIEKLGGLDIQVIAPSHGLVWRQDPMRIVRLYQEWAGYATDPGKAGVTMLYGTMYGNTERMMNAVAEGLSSTGVPLNIFDAARTHASYILPSLWVNRGVVVGAPTYEVSLFPPVAQALEVAAHKRVLNKTAAYFGSYGWSKGAHRQALQITDGLKWNWTECLEFAGAATKDDLHEGESLGRRFGELILSQDEPAS